MVFPACGCKRQEGIGQGTADRTIDVKQRHQSNYLDTFLDEELHNWLSSNISISQACQDFLFKQRPGTHSFIMSLSEAKKNRPTRKSESLNTLQKQYTNFEKNLVWLLLSHCFTRQLSNIRLILYWIKSKGPCKHTKNCK